VVAAGEVLTIGIADVWTIGRAMNVVAVLLWRTAQILAVRWPLTGPSGGLNLR
jgi:hypothetical protein